MIAAPVDRAVGVLWLSVLVEPVLYGATTPVMPYIQERHGLSYTACGFFFGSYALALLLAGPWAQRLAERHAARRKRVLLAGSAVLCVATAAFGTAATFAGLLLARFVQGGAAALTWAVGFPLLSDVVPGAQRERVLANAMLAQSVGFMLSAPLAGFLMSAYGFEGAFVALAAVVGSLLALQALFVFDAGRATVRHVYGGEVGGEDEAAFLLGEEPAPAAEGGAPPPASWYETFVQPLHDRCVLWTAVCYFVGNFCVAVAEPFLPLFLSAEFAMSVGGISMCFGALSVGYSAMAYLSGALGDRTGLWGEMVLAGMVLSAFLLPFLVSERFVGLVGAEVGLLVLFGAGSGTFVTAASTAFAVFVESAPRTLATSALVLSNTAFALAFAVAPVLAGAIADAATLDWAFTAVAALVFATAVVVMVADFFFSSSSRYFLTLCRPHLAPPGGSGHAVAMESVV